MVNPKQSTGRPAGLVCITALAGRSIFRLGKAGRGSFQNAGLAANAKPIYPSVVSKSNPFNSDEAAFDESKERQRLASSYAAMTDGELLNLARSAESLTEAAWDALEDELDLRHLEVPVDPPKQELDVRELIPIRQFRDLPEALLAKGCLESAGIECFFRDDNLIRLDWFISNFIGGIKLCVAPEDAEKAHTILDEPMLEGFYVQGVGLYEQPRCPKCNSLDVNLQEFDRAGQHSVLRCGACDAEWEDEEVPGAAESAD